MKPGPEHIGVLFRYKDGRRARLIALRDEGALLQSVTGEISPLIPHAEFERDWSLIPSSSAAPSEGAADQDALLSRLLAAGFDDVELALRATRDVPAPTYRLIGYWENERISYTQIFADEGDLGRIEAAVLEKLEALKAERAAKDKEKGI